MPRKPAHLVMPNTAGWFCLSCGCDDKHACPKGCCWVLEKVCSSCATAEELFTYEVARRMGRVAEVLNGVFKLPAVLLGVVQPSGPRPGPGRLRLEHAQVAPDRTPKGLKPVDTRHSHPKHDRQAILDFLSLTKPIKVKDVAKHFKISPIYTRVILEGMVDAHLIRKKVHTTGANTRGRKPYVYFRMKPE